MVSFELVNRNGDILTYRYYPEGDGNKDPGEIVVDLSDNEINIVKVAEDDIERDIPADEMNLLTGAINEMKKEAGETDFVELTEESEHSIYYGDHAVREIQNRLGNGEIPEKGMQIWY